MRVQQNGAIWDKFLEEREKYYKNPAVETYEWRFEDCNLVISYNGKNNSINYSSNRDSDNGVGLTVKYSKDDKITEVLAYSKENGQRKYNDLTPLLRDLGSDISCLNFSSTSNPFAEVMPLNSPTYKDAILFDVMMRTAYKYIEQENKDVTLAVCYNGHGSAGTPTAKVFQGKNFTTTSLDMPYKTEIYNPDILYSIEYYNQEIDKQREPQKESLKLKVEPNLVVDKYLMRLVSVFIEYRVATAERLRQQDRINKVVQKIIDNNLELSSLSNHFKFSGEYGLLYKMAENSFTISVQRPPKMPNSFAEVMRNLEIAKYSYQEKEDYIQMRCDEAEAFLKDFDELEKMVNQLTIEKPEKPMTEVCIMPGTSLNFAMSALKELAKEKGNACFAKFNEKTITSDMTLNEAYIKCTGMPGNKNVLNTEDNLDEKDVEPER